MDKTQIKKELYISKADAQFSHYKSGMLYYNVQMSNGLFQFPIPVTEIETAVDTIKVVVGDETHVITSTRADMILSKDLGETPFDAVIPGRHLIRWIEKAIDAGSFKAPSN